MPLWLAMVAIVTIMIFVVLREYRTASTRFELKPEQTEKVKECGYEYVVQSQDVPISDRKSRGHTKKTRLGLRLDKSFPKHKRDPRVFVDGEEIGDEPYS